MEIVITNKLTKESSVVTESSRLFRPLRDLLDAIEAAHNARDAADRQWFKTYEDPDGLREKACRLEEQAQKMSDRVSDMALNINPTIARVMWVWFSLRLQEQEDDSYF